MIVTVNTLFFAVYSESGTAWSTLVCMLAFEWYVGKSLEFVLNRSLFYEKKISFPEGISCTYIKKDIYFYHIKISISGFTAVNK